MDNRPAQVSGEAMEKKIAEKQVNNQSEKSFVALDSFDENAFESIKSLLKSELAIAIEEFLEDANAYMNEVEKGVKTHDFDKICRGSHPLKSNSKGFGLSAVSQIAEKINYMCEHEEQNEQTLIVIKSLCPKLRKAFDIGEKKLQSLMKENLS